jgi:hypothetical protein
MPKRKDETEKAVIVRVRMDEEIRSKCEKARLAGAHSSDPESAFVGYLVRVGLAKYESCILPAETSMDEQPLSSLRKSAIS